MKKTILGILAILAFACFPASAQQPLQIVNDASPAWSDDDVYILFTANPASVTANGSTISGVRDASLPIGTVTTSTTANGSALVSTSFSGHDLPATPFPIQFLSGNNSAPVGNATAAPVFQVTAYSNGNFTVNGTLLPMTNSDQFVVGAYSQQLSSLPIVGNLTSSLSGRTQKIYQVTLGNNFAAGVVFVSYGAPLTYTNASPSPSQTQTLFQIFEVTTANGGGATTSDLTYIDAYGFPLQIESVYTSNSTSSDRRTFYFSGNSVASDLDSIGTLTTNSTILRLGPGQFASANKGNPSPFPSFSEYLHSVLTSDQTQVIAGVQAFGTPNPPTVYGVTVVGGYTQTYSYNATLSADAGGNFTYTLTPFGTNTINGTVPPYFPPIQNVSSLTVNLPADSLNETIYGCTLTSQSFQVNVSGNQSLTPVTFSGNFAVSSATSNSIVSTDTNLVQLAVTQLGGTWLNFLSGNLAGNATVPINSGTLSNGNATISLVNPLSSIPQSGDRFEILFQVDSVTNTTSSFATTQLGSNNLNYITGNITFVQCSGLSSNNTNQTVSIAAVDSLGNIRLQKALKSVPVAGDIFRISAPAQDVQTQLYTNSGFAWVAADVMSALNLGFIGGTAGDSSIEWFGQFPQKFPYGLARPVPDDGFYNPWGAYFYNASDGYAFAFSDRIQPSPLLSTDPTSQALRLTILPHDQIDAPLVTATTTNSSMSLSWDPQNGVAYSVATQPSLPTGGNITVNSTNGTAQLTGLPPGTPFEITVTGAKGNQTSYTLPQIFSTNGTATPVAGTPFFQIQFIWAGGAPAPLDVSRYNVRLNGQTLTWITTNPLSVTANLTQAAGSNGTNLYVIDFIDTQNGNQTVMQSVLQMDLSAVSATQFTVDGTPTVLGSSGAVALIGSTSGNQTYSIPAAPGLSPLVVAINFTPTATKQYAPVVLPDPSPKPKPSPNLKVSPLSINLNSTTVGMPSIAYNFTVSGNYLTSNVNIAAPSGFQISTDLASNYSTAVSLSPGNGILSPTTVFVRMPANTVGPKAGKVMVKSSGAATQSLAVQGTVNPAKSAALIPSPTSLSKFTATSPTPSKSKSFTVKSISINQNILVTAPTNFQIAPNNGDGFGSSLTLPAKGGVINVRIAPNAPIGPVSGSVALQSGNTTAAVTLSGTVNPAPTPQPSPTPSPTPTPTPQPGVQLSFTPSVVNVPSTTVGTPSLAGSFQVEGSGLSGSIVVDGDNPNFQLALSASGPFSGDSITLTPTSGNLSVSVYVRATGSTQGNFTENIIGLGGGGAFAYGTATGSVAPAQERTLAFLPASLSGFQTTQGTPSAWKLVELSGSGFPSKTPITIEAPMGFQVASKPSGPWGKSISTNTNQFPMPIYIRLSGNQAGFLPDYSFNGSLYAYGGGVDASVVVSGLTYPPVSLGASPTTLARFNTTRGVSSAAQSVMFGPSAACIYTGPISITAPTGYEVSLDGINYTPSLSYTVPESVNGQQWVEEFSIRISAKASKGKANGVATLTTPGIKSPVQIKISGKVN